MAYTINLTDGSIFTTISNGTIDNTSETITLVGKNYSGYGEIIAENFVHIIENSADDTFTGTPLKGECWFDTASKVLKVYSGTSWKSVSGGDPSATEPTDPVAGDLWFNTASEQLNVYRGVASAGGAFILVGPSTTAALGQSGQIITTVTDTLAATHVVVEYWVNNELVSISSKDAEFTPQTLIPGFPTIKPGYQLSTSVSGGTPLFEGTSTDSEKLSGIGSDGYLSALTNDTTAGTLGVLNDGGLVVGANADLQISISGTNAFITNISSGGRLVLQATTDAGPVDVVTIGTDATVARASVDTPLSGTDIANMDYVDNSVQTGAEIKALYEVETNAFTDSQFTKLAGIETGATADQTPAEIKIAYDNHTVGAAFGVVDFGGASTQSWDLASDVTLSAIAIAAGRRVDYVLTALTVDRVVTLPATWISYGETSPITIPVGKRLFLSFTALGSANTDIHIAAVPEN